MTTKQPKKLFEITTIAAADVVEKHPSIIDDLPKSLAKTITDFAVYDKRYRALEQSLNETKFMDINSFLEIERYQFG